MSLPIHCPIIMTLLSRKELNTVQLPLLKVSSLNGTRVLKNRGRTVSKIFVIFLLFITSSSLSHAMKNPAAVYCTKLGYDYEKVQSPEGEQGLCVINGTEFDAWDFFVGKVGINYSYCHSIGMDTITLDNGKDPFSPVYSACVESGSLKMMSAGKPKSVSELMNLKQLVQERIDTGNTAKAAMSLKSYSYSTIPPFFDWRKFKNKNWVTSIKDQGDCGSCWAFASVAGVEAALKISRNQPNFNYDLSEQYLISDCCVDCGNCEGGEPYPSLDLIKNQGIPDEKCFPYLAADSACTTCLDSSKRLFKIANFGSTTDDTMTMKSHLVEKGPLVACFFVDGEWYTDKYIYKCGSPPFNPETAHCVLLTGYNDTGQYWLFKNSWGTGNWSLWDKLGYGECGLAQRDSYYIEMDNDQDGFMHYQDCNDTNPNVNPSKVEVCNNIDDNCDGVVDAFSRPCGYSTVGVCKMGTQTCNKGKWQACVGAVSPTKETCNNLDDDCDGSVDESIQQPCSIRNKGICAIGTEKCSSGVWFGCPMPKQEICDNGIDENCDGSDLLCKCKVLSPKSKPYNVSRIPFTVQCPQTNPYVRYSDNNGKSYKSLCTNCFAYNRTTTFDEGNNTIIVTSFSKDSKPLFVGDTLKFLIDTKKPIIHDANPDRGVTKGPFVLDYSEENLKSITFYYGTSSLRKNSCNSTLLSNCCGSGEKKNCTFTINLKPLDNRTLSYYFMAEDIVGHKIKSSQFSVKVDITPPLISLKNYVQPNYLFLNISISEKSDVTFLDQLDANARSVRICTNCLGSKGKYLRYSFKKGPHKLIVTAIDSAGNSGTKTVVFSI